LISKPWFLIAGIVIIVAILVLVLFLTLRQG